MREDQILTLLGIIAATAACHEIKVEAVLIEAMNGYQHGLATSGAQAGQIRQSGHRPGTR